MVCKGVLSLDVTGKVSGTSRGRPSPSVLLPNLGGDQAHLVRVRKDAWHEANNQNYSKNVYVTIPKVWQYKKNS